jgi:hypothetical protein
MGWAASATLGACLSVEQVIFAPKESRRQATWVAIGVVLPVLVAYSVWAGHNPRQALTLAQRVHFAVSKGGWYVFFPAMGLGLHSGLRAFLNSAVGPWTSCTGSGGAFLELAGSRLRRGVC